MNVAGKMKAAINAIPYGAAAEDRPAVQAPLLGSRTTSIYGGLTYTNQPNAMHRLSDVGLFLERARA